MTSPTSLWFVVPAHGRHRLASICLRRLRHTCDQLLEHDIQATAVVISDDANLDTARALGFATVERDNRFLSRRFNDGIQLACDRPLPPPKRAATMGRYLVTGRREYRGHTPGSVFEARLDRAAEARAVRRRDIRCLELVAPSLVEGSYTLPDGWDIRPADYVVPIGSDDWIDPQILLPLPDQNTIVGFQQMSFVREDGAEMVTRVLAYRGGAGIRIYPRQIMEQVGYRPADEDRERGCDTSILTNLTERVPGFQVEHRVIDPKQLVDWKSSGHQLNGYRDLDRHRCGDLHTDPFEALSGVYPDDALGEMQQHYGWAAPPGEPHHVDQEPAASGLIH